MLNLAQRRTESRVVPARETLRLLRLREETTAAFTVLELMMVIGVLSVLLAIVLPSITTARAAALRRQAKAEASALAQAAIHYKTEYGFWPGQLEEGNSEGIVKVRTAFETSDSQPWLSCIISRFQNIDFKVTSEDVSPEPVYIDENWVYRSFRVVGEKSGEVYKANPQNPKGIKFLDLKNEEKAEEVSYPDPWGREYVLIMGLNPRSTFTHTVSVGGSETPSYFVSVSNAIAFAFSFGPNGRNSTNYIYSTGVGP